MVAVRLLRCVVAAAAVVVTTSAWAGAEANLFYGRKQMDVGLDLEGAPAEQRALIDSLEDQDEAGMLLTFGHDWPVALAVDILSSNAEELIQGAGLVYRYTFRTLEIDLGVRKYWGKKVQFYVGGGAAVIDGELEIVATGTSRSASDDDMAFGGFVDAGVVWRIGSAINLGLDLRYSRASGHLRRLGENFELGGSHYGIFAGGRW
jgi:hypothetical protein